MVYQWFILKKTIIFQGFRGPTFTRGGSTFSRGVQMLISIETPYPPSGSAHV